LAIGTYGIGSFTPKTVHSVTVTRSVATVDTSTTLTIAATFDTRIIDGSFFRIELPYEQIQAEGATADTVVGATSFPGIAITDLPADSKVYIDIDEGTMVNPGANSGDSFTANIELTTGFKNGRYVIDPPTQYIVLSSWFSGALID